MKKKNRKLWICIALLVFLVFVGIGLMAYPILSAQYAEHVRSEIKTQYEEVLQEAETADLDAILVSAIEYNERYFKGEVDPLDPGAYGYFEELVLPDTDVMAYITIPKLNLTLPVYHGIGDNALNRGCGHMPQSSLPVGGVNTHAVLSAHSGMAESPMFTDLELMEEGDQFQIRVLGECLTYEVESVSVVLPEAISTVQIKNGRDLVTLVTCTPYGINTHRLIVTGSRIETPVEEEVLPTDPKENEKDTDTESIWIEEYWKNVKIGIYVAGGLLLLIVILIFANYFRKKYQNAKKQGDQHE